MSSSYPSRLEKSPSFRMVKQSPESAREMRHGERNTCPVPISPAPAPSGFNKCRRRNASSHSELLRSAVLTSINLFSTFRIDDEEGSEATQVVPEELRAEHGQSPVSSLKRSRGCSEIDVSPHIQQHKRFLHSESMDDMTDDPPCLMPSTSSQSNAS